MAKLYSRLFVVLISRKDAQNANISSKLEDEQNTVAQLQKRLKELQVRRHILFFCTQSCCQLEK